MDEFEKTLSQHNRKRRQRRAQKVERLKRDLAYFCTPQVKKAILACRPTGKGEDAIRRSIVRKAICKYPMPSWIVDGIALNKDPSRHSLIRVCQGASFFEEISSLYPDLRLTRREAHLLFNGEPKNLQDYPVVLRALGLKSLRAGASFSQTKALVDGLKTSFRRWRNWIERTVPFTQWLGDHSSEFGPQWVVPLLDYVLLGAPDGFSLKGRSFRSLRRLVVEWHNLQLGINTEVKKEEIDHHPSIDDKSYILPVDGFDHLYTVEQIVRFAQLKKDATKLRHCAMSYWPEVEKGKATLWRMVVEGPIVSKPLLTIELRGVEVVQARGVCNRLPEDDEKRVLSSWAKDNYLKIAPLL